jgi:hypothetical protein
MLAHEARAWGHTHPNWEQPYTPKAITNLLMLQDRPKRYKPSWHYKCWPAGLDHQKHFFTSFALKQCRPASRDCSCVLSLPAFSLLWWVTSLGHSWFPCCSTGPPWPVPSSSDYPPQFRCLAPESGYHGCPFPDSPTVDLNAPWRLLPGSSVLHKNLLSVSDNEDPLFLWWALMRVTIPA